MPSLPHRPYLHLVPIEPGECLTSWILRIANRDSPNFKRFSSRWLADDLRVTPGFDAFPAASLLTQLGAIHPDQLDHYITHHTLLGTTKCFYTESEWEHLINTHGAAGSRLYTLRQKTRRETWHICPSCRRQQAERGVFIWPRNPQIPGIFHCPNHEVPVPLVLRTATRIPPYASPAAGDLLPEQGGQLVACVGREEDHLTLVRDVTDALTAGLKCRHPEQTFRKSIAQPLFGGPWSPKLKIWPALVARFGEPFLDVVQVRRYHNLQTQRAQLHPSYHGIVYLALLARTFGATLRTLLASSC